MSYEIARGVKLEVQKTVAVAKSVTALTQASPGVATSAAHGMSDGAVGYFASVAGMVTLEGQAVRIDNPATNTFELQNIDTTSMPAFTSGSFYTVTAWDTVGNSTDVDIGGGAADKQDQTTLIDDIKQEIVGLLAAQTVTVTGWTDDQSAAMKTIEAAAFASTPLVFRLTSKTGKQRVWRGIPSLPGEKWSVGQTPSGSFEVTVSGRVVKLPVIA